MNQTTTKNFTLKYILKKVKKKIYNKKSTTNDPIKNTN